MNRYPLIVVPQRHRYTTKELFFAAMVLGLGGVYLLGHVVLWLIR